MAYAFLDRGRFCMTDRGGSTRRIGASITVAAILLLAPPFVTSAAAAAAPGPPAPVTPVIQRANDLMALTADAFETADKGAQGNPFELSTDGCSGPLSFHHVPCVQHDFGYRNYGAKYGVGLSVTRETKDWIDNRFKEEMDRVCAEFAFSPPAAQQCTDEANIALEAVRRHGDPSFF